MDLKEKTSKLISIENKLVVKLEDTIDKRSYDEAYKVISLLMNIQKLKAL